MTKKILILLLSLFLFSSNHINAQEEELPPVNMVGFQFGVMLPVGSFQDRNDDPTIGVSFSYMRQLKPETPLFLGFNIGFYFHDRESNYYLLIEDVFEYDINHVTSIKTGIGKLTLRYMPDLHFILFPFVEGGLGGRYMFAYSELEDDDSGETFDGYLEGGDWGYSFTLEGGVMINAWESLMIQLGIRFHQGNSTDYYVRNPSIIDPDLPIDAFTQTRSNVHFFNLNIGLQYIF